MMIFVGYATNDGEIVCEHCVADSDADGVTQLAGGDECDSPEHCAYCSRPIDCSLTSDGVAYVLAAVRRDMKRGRAYRLSRAGFQPGNYFYGATHYEFMCSWVDLIDNHRLDHADRRLLDLFHAWSV